MSTRSGACPEFEPDILAAASGEADAAVSERVDAHAAGCTGCRDELARYRAIEAGVSSLAAAGRDAAAEDRARAELQSRLADLSTRLVRYGIFPSPLGPLLVAASEQGVLLVEYLDRGRNLSASQLGRTAGIEAIEDRRQVEPYLRDLLDAFAGRRARLDWPLDLRLARSDFHRRVLERTRAIPFGAVLSYAGLAREIGRPEAVRAAAQALRWNPLPVVIPCHRIVGSSGDLTGYAGGATTRKRKLLSAEGVPTARAHGDWRVQREAMYILAPGEQEYCLPSCPSVVKADAFPRGAVLFCSRERAEAEGLKPCTTCRPDLHPIHV